MKLSQRHLKKGDVVTIKGKTKPKEAVRLKYSSKESYKLEKTRSNFRLTKSIYLTSKTSSGSELRVATA